MAIQPMPRQLATADGRFERNTRLLWELMGVCFRPHPWHGLQAGVESPAVVSCYVEIVPTDTVKYEIDKDSGYLRVDRPQRFSNCCPTLYGFVPQTFCGEKVAEYCGQAAARSGLAGDGDPLDICVLTKEPITHGDILLEALPIGGLRVIDNDEVDDKIVAVLKGDIAYGHWRDILDCPPEYLQRIQHYFATYKQLPSPSSVACELLGFYGREEAHEVIRRSQADYHRRFGTLPEMLTEALNG